MFLHVFEAEVHEVEGYLDDVSGVVRPMERAPGTLSHQHSHTTDELQSAGVGRRNRWATAGAAVLNMQKEQAMSSNTSRSHFPRSHTALPTHCNSCDSMHRLHRSSLYASCLSTVLFFAVQQ